MHGLITGILCNKSSLSAARWPLGPRTCVSGRHSPTRVHGSADHPWPCPGGRLVPTGGGKNKVSQVCWRGGLVPKLSTKLGMRLGLRCTRGI